MSDKFKDIISDELKDISRQYLINLYCDDLYNTIPSKILCYYSAYSQHSMAKTTEITKTTV